MEHELEQCAPTALPVSFHGTILNCVDDLEEDPSRTRNTSVDYYTKTTLTAAGLQRLAVDDCGTRTEESLPLNKQRNRANTCVDNGVGEDLFSRSSVLRDSLVTNSLTPTQARFLRAQPDSVEVSRAGSQKNQFKAVRSIAPNSSEIPPTATSTLERLACIFQTESGLEQAIYQQALQFLLQQMMYSREISYDRLCKRLSSLISDKGALMYTSQFPKELVVSYLEAMLFFTSDAPLSSKSYIELDQLVASLSVPYEQHLAKKRKHLKKLLEKKQKLYQKYKKLSTSVESQTNMRVRRYTVVDDRQKCDAVAFAADIDVEVYIVI